MNKSARKNALYFFSVVTMIALFGVFIWLEEKITRKRSKNTFTVHGEIHQKIQSLISQGDCKSSKAVFSIGNFQDISFVETNKVDSLPFIYVITPTYTRLVQKVELTRVSMVLKAVPNIHWLVIEDSANKTALVSRFLENSGLNYTHLAVATPKEHTAKNPKLMRTKHRGVSQRNAALKWLKDHLNPSTDEGVFYFADDDNTYTTELFDEIRNTSKVSVFPIGLMDDLRYESPILKNGKVVAWYSAWKKNERRFAMDMGAFAVNIKLILTNPKAYFSFSTPLGFLETAFVETLNVTLNDLEPKANMCTKVLVWHTRTVNPVVTYEKKMKELYNVTSNPNVEV